MNHIGPTINNKRHTISLMYQMISNNGICNKVLNIPMKGVEVKSVKLTEGKVYTFTSKAGDTIQLLYLLLDPLFGVNPTTLEGLELDFLYQRLNSNRSGDSPNNFYVVQRYPSWLLRFLIRTGKSQFEETTIINGKLAIPLACTRPLLPCTSVRVKITGAVSDNDDPSLELVACATFYGDSQSRKKKFELMPHHIFQILKENVILNKLETSLSFGGISSTLLINTPHIDDILFVKITYKDHILLDYDATLLRLLATTHDDTFAISFNPQTDAVEWDGINFATLTGCRLIVAYHDSCPKTWPVNICLKSINASTTNDKITVLKFDLGTIVNVGVQWFSSFSVRKVNKNSFIEGYWFDEDRDDFTYPTPQPSACAVEDDFIERLSSMLARASGDLQLIDCVVGSSVEIDGFIISKQYELGSSTCRVCGQKNGNAEYCISNSDSRQFIMPEGYLHYLKNHNIHPSEDFCNFNKNKTNFADHTSLIFQLFFYNLVRLRQCRENIVVIVGTFTKLHYNYKSDVVILTFCI